MSSETQNYGYPKPDTEDFYDVGDFNRAMDMIDGDVKGVQDAISALSEGKANETELVEHKGAANPHSITKDKIGLGNVPNVPTNEQTPTFTQSSSRENINSGEKLSSILGKVKKWFADLKMVAFTGNYNDLINRPSVPVAVRVKGNAEGSYRTGDVNLTPGNIGSPSMDYINGHFVPDYVSSARGAETVSKGWYRIAESTKDNYGNSCIVSLKRGYNSPAPEYQKFQLLNVYGRQKFVLLAASSASHLWTKIRETFDEANSKTYIEIYQGAETYRNTWLITIEDALGMYGNNWKAIIPTLTQETINGVTVVADMDLPANFDSSRDIMDISNGKSINFSFHKEALTNWAYLAAWTSNSAGTGYELRAKDPGSLIVQQAGKAIQDGDGNVIKDTYLPLKGGTITGNLRLKGSGNYGNALNFGDGDYVKISEPTDDHLEVKGSYINFVTGTGTGRFTVNGNEILSTASTAPKAVGDENGNNIAQSLNQRPKLAASQKGAKIQYGRVAVLTTANTIVDFSGSFPENFSQIPTVIIQPSHNSLQSITCLLKNITVNGFTGALNVNGGGTVIINWIAIGI